MGGVDTSRRYASASRAARVSGGGPGCEIHFFRPPGVEEVPSAEEPSEPWPEVLESDGAGSAKEAHSLAKGEGRAPCPFPFDRADGRPAVRLGSNGKPIVVSFGLWVHVIASLTAPLPVCLPGHE